MVALEPTGVERVAWDGDEATVTCDGCELRQTIALKPAEAKAYARTHTRRTGHTTLVEHARITEYTRHEEER
jgi:hypothetical protein